MSDNISLPYPQELGHYGCVEFIFYPHVVECQLTFLQGQEVQEKIGRVHFDNENYDIIEAAQQALEAARKNKTS